MFTIFAISMLIGVSLADKRARGLLTSLVSAFCERKSAPRQKSHPKRPFPVSFSHTLVLATMTHLSRVEKFVKRFHPPQQGNHRDSFWLTKETPIPTPKRLPDKRINPEPKKGNPPRNRLYAGVC